MFLRQTGKTLLAVLAFALAALLATPASAAVCSYATGQGASGPANWDSYCWLDFAGYVDATARSAAGQNFSYTLTDGSVMQFNLKVSGAAVVAATSPSWSGSAFGNSAFTGIGGRPVIYQSAAGTTTVTISGLTITPPVAGTVTSYMLVAADAESSNDGETLRFQTNGGDWQLLDLAGNGTNYPTYTGLGSSSFTITGVPGTVGSQIVGSANATSLTTTLVGGGLQGAIFAVRFASIKLRTQIAGTRIAAADQFTFSVRATSSGSALASGTSTGTGLGPFVATPLTTASAMNLTLTQTMASGSSSAIGQYRSSLSCTNAVTSVTPMPSNVITTSYAFGSLQFGDNVTCTFTETPFPHLQLVKALATGGRRFASDQFVMQISQGTSVVATTTTTGTGATVTNGATPQYGATAGTAYSLGETGAGSTALSQYSSAMACTNAWSGSTTVLPTAPGGSVTPQMGDVITCTITNTRRAANATLQVSKQSTVYSDPVNATTNPFAIPGAVVTYAIRVENTGSLTVNNNSVFMVDTLPTTIAVGTASSPVFVQGTPSSGLTFNAATDLRYSNSVTAPATFAACTYTPVSAYDPLVRHVCIRPQGSMAASTGTPPSFTISFRSQIR